LSAETAFDRSSILRVCGLSCVYVFWEKEISATAGRKRAHTSHQQQQQELLLQKQREQQRRFLIPVREENYPLFDVFASETISHGILTEFSGDICRKRMNIYIEKLEDENATEKSTKLSKKKVQNYATAYYGKSSTLSILDRNANTNKCTDVKSHHPYYYWNYSMIPSTVWNLSSWAKQCFPSSDGECLILTLPGFEFHVIIRETFIVGEYMRFYFRSTNDLMLSCFGELGSIKYALPADAAQHATSQFTYSWINSWTPEHVNALREIAISTQLLKIISRQFCTKQIRPFHRVTFMLPRNSPYMLVCIDTHDVVQTYIAVSLMTRDNSKIQY
jgi:hypothetical protein